ncbi:MAG: 6-pyruvoyl tetrahydropterin synthase family protein [Hyphomonadaceae bacterium]
MPALEFSRRYAMAHRLRADPASRCATPHGHNETVVVRLKPTGLFRFSGANMDAPFDRAKGRWRAWIDEQVDHCLMLDEADPLLGYFRAHEPERLSRIMAFPGDPTTEALAACFFLKCAAFLAADDLPFSVEEVRVAETPTNTVVMHAAHFDPAACGLPDGAWPRRADMSINDFT